MRRKGNEQFANTAPDATRRYPAVIKGLSWALAVSRAGGISSYAADRCRKRMNELPSFRIGGEEREFLLVQAVARSHPQSYDFWDSNWLDTRIRVSAGAFAGGYRASLRCEEFAHFLSSLRLVYTSQGTEIPSHVAEFAAMEEQLSVVVRGDGLGNFVAHCIAVDELGTGNRLEFDLAFDQTYIPTKLTGLESVLEAFPVLGSPLA